MPPDAARTLSLRQANIFLAFERLPQPVIAAVGGVAFGAGCVAAYSCDLRLASHAARFGMPEITLGWPPGYGIAQLSALRRRGSQKPWSFASWADPSARPKPWNGD